MESKILNYKKDSPFKTYEYINRALKNNPEEFYGSLCKGSGDAENLDSYEKSVRLIIFDSLKSKEGVIAALLSNDLQQIRRALHCKWFFEDALLPEYYIKNIFPNVSFSTRCKIIHQLSKHLKHEDHAEELLDFIQCHYGKGNAVILLPKCSPEFVNSYLKDGEVIFHFGVWRKLLWKLVPKYPQLVLDILESWCNKNSLFFKKLSALQKIFLYIAKHHPKLFIPFFERNYNALYFLHFGDKLRRSLSPALLDIVFKSNKTLRHYSNMFNEENLFRDLDFQGKVYLLSKIIRSVDMEFFSWSYKLENTRRYLKTIPPNERAELLAAVYQHVQKKNLWENSEAWTYELLRLMPPEVRENCVSVLINQKKSDVPIFKRTSVKRNISDQLAYLLDCKKSIPKLKEMIKKMPSPDDRNLVLVEMIESCAINEDLESFCSVCNYIKNRHRNEGPKVILSLLEHAADSFDSLKFDLKLWTVLEELLTMCILTNESSYSIYKKMMEKYAFFRLRNNLDPKEQIKNLVKYAILYENGSFKFMENVRVAYADVYFYTYYNEIMLAISEGNLEKEKIKFLYESIIETMNDFNAQHVDNKIISLDLKGFTSCLDNLIELYKTYDRENFELKISSIISVILKDENLKLRCAELCETFNKSGIMDSLKKNPNEVLQDLKNLFHRLFDASNKYCKISRKKQKVKAPVPAPWRVRGVRTCEARRALRARRQYVRRDQFIDNIYFWKKILDFYNASENFKIFALEKFQELNLDNAEAAKKVYALKLFSYFTDILEYEECIQDYIPKSKEIDYKNCSKESVNLQKTIPALIKNVKPDSKNFSLIFKFLVGDYLKYVLGSFNAACYNSPVELVISTLNEKIDSPVSVKKAILRNIGNVLTLEQKIKFCIDLWEKESHDSIRRVIFKEIIETFTAEPKPTEESFNAVKKCILESSEVIIQARPKVEEIPPSYRSQYVDAIWNYADGINNNDNLKNSMKDSLIDELNKIKNIDMLSDELGEKIIKSEMFIDNPSITPFAFNNFVCSYLFCNPESISRKLNVLLDLMRERKKNYKAIMSFIDIFVLSCSFNHSEHSFEIFNTIVQIWPTIFARYELFEEFLMLQYGKSFYEILIKEDSKDVLNITIKFADELKKIIKNTPNYPELLMIFHSTIIKFLRAIKRVNGSADETLFIRQLITPPEREFLILAAFLLPGSEVKQPNWGGREDCNIELELNETDELEDDTITMDKKKNLKHIYKELNNCKDDVFQIHYLKRFLSKKYYDTELDD